MQLLKTIRTCAPVIAMLIFCSSGATAQQVWPNHILPFMPKRDTTHIRARIQYELSDVIMGKRTPIDTLRYGRHGYEVSHNTRVAFDTLGRITDREVTFEEMQTIEHVEYNAEGVVRYYRSNQNFLHAGVAPDTIVHTYRLINFVRHPQIGITRAAYRGAHSRVYNDSIPPTEYDTLVVERVFDAKSRLIQDYIEGSWPDRIHDEQNYYYYDANGHISAKKHLAGTYYDSTSFQYNIMSEMIGGSGKGNDEEEAWDFIFSCTPKRVPVRRTTIYHITQFDDIAQQWMEVQSTYNVYFDHKGNISRREVPDEPIKEFDYIYWDE